MQIQNIEFTIGADPEFFVLDQDKKPISAKDLSIGTKKRPEVISEGNLLQVDGLALELNIHPRTSLDGFMAQMKSGIDYVEKRLSEKNYSILKTTPVANFGKEYLDQQPKENRELGCDPDYNAYTKSVNPIPNADLPFRTASGHIHIGWTKDIDPLEPSHFEACCMLTKWLDLFVALPAKCWELATENDGSYIRRALYGKAGAFRPKPYGMEYRVLDNFWIFEDKLVKTVFKNVETAISVCFKHYDHILDPIWQHIPDIVNRNVTKEDNITLHNMYINGVMGHKMFLPSFN